MMLCTDLAKDKEKWEGVGGGSRECGNKYLIP